jgi:hypothetical protein
LSNVSGDVRVRPPGGEWRPAKEGERVGPNWNVNSHDGGHVEVRFDDGTVAVPDEGLLVIYGKGSQPRHTRSPRPSLQTKPR